MQRYLERIKQPAVPPWNVLAAGVFALFAAGGCPGVPAGTDAINPFRDLPAISLDGRSRDLTRDIVPLGPLSQGQVIRLEALGDGIEAVLILAEDEVFEDAGRLAGGGPANEPFDYRVQVPGRHFAFVQFGPEVPRSQQRATLSARLVDTDFSPPAVQRMRIVFADGFLTSPGLFDPESNTEADRQFLESISETVRAGVLNRLRALFADSPIEIVADDEPMPEAPFSTLTFLPDRVVADEPLLTDSALPPPDPTRPQCQVRVVFGEVLPRGAKLDPGNRVLDDSAVVYVGSFQGRGATCRSAAIDSVNNIVLGLSQTAAHEIGHLVGLYHVPLIDIMDRSPTLAFQRELGFQRGQILLDSQRTLADGTAELATVVLTTVIQDPAFYFAANFGR